MNIRDLILSRQKKDDQFQKKISVLRCITVGIDFANDCAVKDRKGYIWVREQKTDGSIFQVFNSEVKRLVGLPVLVSSSMGSPFRKVVSSVDWDVIPLTSDTTVLNSPSVYNHGLSHEWQDTYPAADAISIYPRALVPFRVYPSVMTGIKVDVAKGYYASSMQTVYYSGIIGYDLTTYKPASGYVGVLVYLDPETNSVNSSVSGNSVADAGDIIYPDIPARILPLAYVRVSSIATAITESDIILDLRPMYTITDGSIHDAIGALENEIDIELTRHIVQGV